MTTFSYDLYANIALEALYDSAGECKCEASSHVPEYPCSIEVVALIAFKCAHGFKCCQNVSDEVKQIISRDKMCPNKKCGRTMGECISIIPV